MTWWLPASRCLLLPLPLTSQGPLSEASPSAPPLIVGAHQTPFSWTHPHPSASEPKHFVPSTPSPWLWSPAPPLRLPDNGELAGSS